jgi:hypothetical protein
MEPCNTIQACPLIMDEEGKGQTRSRVLNKKRHTPTPEVVMQESGRPTATHLRKTSALFHFLHSILFCMKTSSEAFLIF